MFFDNSNLSQEIFAIDDTWGAVICSLGHGRKHMLTTFRPSDYMYGDQALVMFFCLLKLKCVSRDRSM